MKEKTALIRKALAILFTALFIILLTPIVLKSLGNFLVEENCPESTQADAIVVLAGDNGERIEKACTLYHKGKAPLFLITGNTFYNTSVPSLMAKKAKSLNVPSSSILLESQSESTLDHPKKCRPLFKKRGIKSIIIVTSKFHTKRAYNVFSKELKNDNINIMVVGADDNIDYSCWWKNHESSEKIAIELGKTIWYALE